MENNMSTIEQIDNTISGLIDLNTKLVNIVADLKNKEMKENTFTTTAPTTLSAYNSYIQNFNNKLTTLTISTLQNNSSILFNTDTTFTYTITVPLQWKINKDFDFQPNKSYILNTANNVIYWAELLDYV